MSKTTFPTVSLLALNEAGKPARPYTNAASTDLRATFARIEQERRKAEMQAQVAVTYIGRWKP